MSGGSRVVLEARDFLGRRVRLGLGSWRHILAKRPWFHEHQTKIAEALGEPEMVLEDHLGELLAIRRFRDLLGRAYPIVIYRPLNREGFIITAYPHKRCKEVGEEEESDMEEALRKLKISGAYIHYDEEVDTLYIHFGEREAVEGIEVEEGVIVDLDENKEPAGITITSFKRRLSEIR